MGTSIQSAKEARHARFQGQARTHDDQKVAIFRLLASLSDAIKEVHSPREEEPDWLPKEWTPQDDEAEEEDG